LVKALQKPEVRGQWGEMHLLRVVEVTGMTDRCDFHEQQVIGDEEYVQRPDLVVHLPGERHLAIDAKAPIRAFLESAEAADDDTRLLKQQDFVTHIREHVRNLGSKAYYQNIDGTPEFVVLYLPTEAIFSAALTLDNELLEYAAKYRVHLAGPSVLITLLRAVAHGWKQEALAKHAKEICDLGEELYKRMALFGGHMGKIGSCLNRSVAAYNQAVGSLESRVMPQVRRFEQLGAAPADAQIEELTQIEMTARHLQSAELAIAEIESEFDEQELLGRPR
jgi:DNA recombination protein RmuC